jgi:hypothetical protein
MAKKRKLNEDTLLDIILRAIVLHTARKEGLKDPEFKAIINKHGVELKDLANSIQQDLDTIDKLNKQGKF